MGEMRRRVWIPVLVSSLSFLVVVSPRVASAQQAARAGGSAQAAPATGAAVTGIVRDDLGAPIKGAKVVLLEDGQPRGEATTDADGHFTFPDVKTGRYQVRANAAKFEPRTSDAFYVGTSARAPLALTLEVGVQESIVVTATATETPASQVAASVSVVDRETLDALKNPDVLNAFRLVPGVNSVQTGPRGGTTSLFIRGGNSNFTKFLVDGTPANDIGGGVDFSNFTSTGVDRVEVLRDPNSAMYGSDAMAGVVNVTTRQGTTRIPETSVGIEGGNFGTSRADLSFGGAVRRFDYFSAVSHFDTDNKIPGSGYRNTTYAGRFGGVVNGSVALSGTLRASTGNFGSTNATTIYGIPDDSTETNRYTFGSLAATFQHSERWQSVVRFGLMDRHETFLNPTPTGQPFDPFGFGPNYLGSLTTITGANGFSVTGQGILDFGGVYPSPFTSNASRESISGQTTYHVSKRVEVSGGLRLDHESGASGSDPNPKASTRNDAGGFVEVRGTLDRLFATASLGVDHDKSFGTAATPRVSVAYYARRPDAGPSLGGTKLTFNAGTGIKSPSVAQEQSSQFEVSQTVPALASKGIQPIGPERSRGFDGGVEQGFWHERVKARVIGFDNHFSDIIEFVSNKVLPIIGIPVDVASALPGGVFVNSSSYKARGLETSVDVRVSNALRLSGSYTFLDAVVTESFVSGSGANSLLPPAFNPAFPDVPIGAFSPLVGGRPFRRPTHSGTVAAFYTRDRLGLALAGQFSGKSDDSTFALDGFFGNSMLLPNKNLNGGYAKIDLTGSYLVHPLIRAFIAFENLLDQTYAPVYGFPALPFTARVGAVITLGGDRR